MSRTTLPNIDVIRSDSRGKTEIGWLIARHSFSFGRYYDPARMGFRSLRVINDDWVKPSRGFGMHEHDNMEILTWVLEGEIAHKDSTGNAGVIRPGDAQLMSAGRGIMHSEMNPSSTQPVHLLQIWIEPMARDLQPGYQQRAFPHEGRKNRWQTIAAPVDRDQPARAAQDTGGPLHIHQDARVSVAELDVNASVDLAIAEKRHAYLHVAYGSVRVGNLTLSTGDAVTFAGPSGLKITASEPTQLVLFDLV